MSLISEKRLLALREKLHENVRRQEQLCLAGKDTRDPELFQLAHDELVLRDTIKQLSKTIDQ